jgi:2-polyprenyl-3-methyl-5-hydroxy-6-metoxy-1,4-benzoquinol methylase
MNIKPLCHLCDTPSNFLMNKDGYDEYLCPKCSLSFVHPQPTADWLRDEVYSLESGYQKNKTSDLSIAKEGMRFGRVLDFVAKNKPNGSFLDIGCSSGQVMHWARKRGLKPVGIEINKRTADIARQNSFEVFNGFLEDSQFEKTSFDIIFMGDVIEHVNNPRKFVFDAMQYLKKDGYIVISTPNVDCLWSHVTLGLYRLFGIPWTSLTPPYHLFQFSLSNLSTLLSEFNFTVEKAFFLPPPSLRYELGSLHLLKRWKENRTIQNALFAGISYGLYTIVYALNFVLHPLLVRDFQMSVVYTHDKPVV